MDLKKLAEETGNKILSLYCEGQMKGMLDTNASVQAWFMDEQKQTIEAALKKGEKK